MGVVIIGAGITGLSAAYRLIELGYNDVTVLDSSAEVGGLSKCFKRDDYIFDLGPHQIHTQDTVVIEYLKKILKDDLLIDQKQASNWFMHRYLNYPMGLNDLLFGLPFSLSVMAFISFCIQSLKNVFVRKDKENFESWVISHFGKKMYDVYFGPYTQKVWGKHPALLSAVCAEERIAVQNLLDVLLSAVSRKITKFRNHYYLPHSPYQKVFYYPKHGIGQLPDMMRETIESKGGSVQLNQTVDAVIKEGDTYTVKTTDGNSYRADSLVSTMPITNLRDMLQHDESFEKPDDNLEFRALTFVFLVVKKENLTKNHWIYFPDKDCVFQRVSEFSNFSPAMAPDGYTNICAEIPCDYQDSVWQMADDILFEKVISTMEQENYLNRSDVVGSWVAREQYAYPTYDLAFSEKLSSVVSYIDKFENLYSTGRQGAFQYVNIDQVMLMGFKAAESIYQKVR
jgi:protoporphyrinogen oxidase